MLGTGLLTIYGCLLTVLFVFLLHRLWMLSMLWQYRRHHRDGSVPTVTDWPQVTVQLPVFNERDVIDRLITAIERLDYPTDRLHIQLLDDSTDDTAQRALKGAERLRRQGIRADVLHRDKRTGFKAGALAEGLQRTDSPYIAVFDADFLPTPDFLRQTVPWLEKGYGMVQARWGHLNLYDSWLTRAQGILLDGHFIIEHTARYGSGRWFNFNGTAGVWRREAILTAGGWTSDTLTEDLDISYRAQLCGWHFKYLPDLVQPAELPATITAFKNQQHRWAKGSIQTARKLLGPIWHSPAPVCNKIEATLHLVANFGYPALLAVLVLLPWTPLFQQHEIASWLPALPLSSPFFPVAFISLALFYAIAVRTLPSQPAGRRLLHIPLALALAIGIAISQTRAVFEGLFGEPGEFQRTPKQGALKSSSYRPPVSALPVPEFLMGAYLVAAWLILAASGHFSTLWFLGLCAFGFLLVGFQQTADSRMACRG